MGRLILPVVICIFVSIAGGCLQDRKPPCEADCEGTSGPSFNPPTTTPPGAIGEFLNSTIEFRNCRGVGGITDPLYDNVRPLVPQEFRLIGLTPLTVNANFHAFQCERVIAGSEIFENTFYFNSYVMVAPRNESRDGKGQDFYLLDQRLSDARLASFISSVGFPAEVASFQVTNTSAPGQATVEQWKIVGNTSTFYLDSLAASPDDQGGGPISFWGGTDSLRRVELDVRYHYRMPRAMPNTFTSEGSSSTKTAFGEKRPVVSFVQEGYNMTWTIDPQNVFDKEGT